MKVAVMTDTNSGISVDEAKSMGIFCMPMPVIVDEQNYIEDVNLTHEQCFKFMEEGRDVSTSQPSPGELIEMWEEILDSGYDQVIYIPMSSGLSISTKNAIVFAKDYEGSVFVADNHRISVTQRQAVMDAIYCVNKGMSAPEIKDMLENTAYDSVIILAVDTLDYLKKTGRVNATAATVGNVLAIKPILKTTGGKFEVYSAIRGSKKLYSKIIEAIQEELDTRFKGVPHEDIIIGTAGSFTEESDATGWCDAVKAAFSDIEVYYNPLSCSVSTHTGPNATGVGISKKVK